ncbi:MAG: UvrD-helicase domain-containing protein [Verrucomicrobiota bacterium]
MSSNLQNTIIRASAGTGKTYQLANRYIALLLLQSLNGGRIAPEKIVAATFTRKGAGEFSERILHRLATAAGDTNERERLQADLTQMIQGDNKKGIAGLATGVSVDVNSAILQSALATVIDHFDRLVLGTIDGFMARSVQTMAFELGLGGFEILEGVASERQREEILAGVLESVTPENTVEFYQNFKRATLRSSSTLRSDLDHFVQDFHQMFTSLSREDAWGGSEFWDKAPARAEGNDWKKQAAELAEIVSGHDFGHATIAKTFAKALQWLAERHPGSAGTPPTWLTEKGQLTQMWRNSSEAEWTFESYKKQRTIPSEITQKLRPILTSWLADERAGLSRKTGAIHTIVASYESHYEQMARRKGRLTFADLPLLLDENRADETARASLTMLAFRWYQKFDHWLLDEFQDTSRLQWGVLKPWIDEAIQDSSGQKSVFVVGDPKQSIYGWRGGEPRLFSELVNEYTGPFNELIMAESWRSRPSVLELVNRICDPEKNQGIFNPKHFSPKALARWRYDQHESSENRKSKPGYSAVLLVAKSETDDEESSETENDENFSAKLTAQAAAIKSVLNKVRPLERGLTCAILTRKNKHAQPIAQWLRSHGVPQVMVEGVATLAEQSPVVAAVVAALRWLAFPADTLSAGHISLTPLWKVLEQPFRGEEADAEIAQGKVWSHWRRRITRIGAAQVTQEWCTELAETQTDPYAQYCLNHVTQTAQLSGVRLVLSDWLATLEKLAVRETAAAGSIHVMTIHKSKGMGFDVVFLPDLDYEGGSSDKILVRRDDDGCPKGCLAYPPKWLQAWDTTLSEIAAEQNASQDLEALCVLYVALTRAKEATFVILNAKKPQRSSSARDWILEALPRIQHQEPIYEGAELYWEHGERDFAERIQASEAAPAEVYSSPKLPPQKPRRKRRRPSDGGHEALVPTSPSAGGSGGKEFGIAVHKVFEQIEWWKPGLPLRGEPDAVSLVKKCLSTPEILALFTQENANDEALRELPVEFIEGDTWWSGVIDRLLLRRNAAGVITKAVVIDFKTDRVQDVASLLKLYTKQLNIYRDAVAGALKLDPKKVELVLVSANLAELICF